jgi:hypothetical protein
MLYLSVSLLQPNGSDKTYVNFMTSLSNIGPWSTPSWAGTSRIPIILASLNESVLPVGFGNPLARYDYLLLGLFTSDYTNKNVQLCIHTEEASTDILDSTATFSGVVSIMPTDVGSPIKLHHVKYGFLEFVNVPSSVSYIQYVSGGTDQSATVSVPTEKDLVKIKGTEAIVRHFRTYVSWAANVGLHAKLKAIHYVVGTERNAPDESIY